MKNFHILLTIVLLFISCSKRYPKIVYMPDMYYSEAYEPYSDAIKPYKKNNNIILFKNRITSLIPVPGTVPRNENGFLPYMLPNTKEGYEASKKITISPMDPNKKIVNLKRGKEMYIIYCAICHNNDGNGEGYLVKKEKILGVPNYKYLNLTIGSIYHVIMYGKNNMGSYASQLNTEDRWKIALYVKELQKNK
ncbi:MAG: cytochrome c [Candidatus Bostrichicola ureolyticus]|nr:MAG: cytochrome c [Candidatus Bostrichicola ureolyticus]